MGDDIEKFKDDTGMEYIKLKVIGSDKNEIHFRVKMSTLMSKLKKSYSDRIGVSPETLRFLYDGVRLSDDATAKSLAMCTDDIIEVYQQQSGGRATSLYKMTNLV